MGMPMLLWQTLLRLKRPVGLSPFNITIMDETGGEWIDSPPVPDPGGLDGGYLGGDLLGLITGGSTPPTQGGFAAPNSPLLQARRIIPEELT